MSLKEFKAKFIENTHPAYTDDPNVLDTAFGDIDYRVRAAAARNQNATKEHLDEALADIEYDVREAAAGNQSATKEHLDKALDDEDGWVRAEAARNPNYKKFYPNGY